MNRKLVVLAGATGELGGKIAKETVRLQGQVRALVRPDTSAARETSLAGLGIEVVRVNYADAGALAKACEGGAVVLSALSGLRPVIVDAQTQLLNAAVQAGVPRFIPSDFAIDFTRIPDGWNRNLNLRSEFRQRLDPAKIRPTSILNGAFTDMLTGTAPFILFGWRRILCWGDPDQLMDWTTMDDTAAYTAAAALDPDTPRFLRIAGDQLSARSLADMMSELTGEKCRIFRPGGPGLLRAMIKMTKAFTPDSDDLYPPWQGMQYMHNLYAGIAKFESLDNDRYPMSWTHAREVLARFLSSSRA